MTPTLRSESGICVCASLPETVEFGAVDVCTHHPGSRHISFQVEDHSSGDQGKDDPGQSEETDVMNGRGQWRFRHLDGRLRQGYRMKSVKWRDIARLKKIPICLTTRRICQLNSAFFSSDRSIWRRAGFVNWTLLSSRLLDKNFVNQRVLRCNLWSLRCWMIWCFAARGQTDRANSKVHISRSRHLKCRFQFPVHAQTEMMLQQLCACDRAHAGGSAAPHGGATGQPTAVVVARRTVLCALAGHTRWTKWICVCSV